MHLPGRSLIGKNGSAPEITARAALPGGVPARRQALRPLEEHEWEGEFNGSSGSARRLVFTMRAALVVTSGVVEGNGRARDFPYQINEPRDLIITGTRSDQLIAMELWFDARFLARTPFVCMGLLSTDERQILGDFSLACFTGCGCHGGAGRFVLRRVDAAPDRANHA
jgi:hypothetical protein